MIIDNLLTPSFLVNLDTLEKNIKEVQTIFDNYGKELWPMIKTHKSSDIAKMQLKYGAKGFLVGTLDEAEILSKQGVENITYAYPVVGKENIRRAIEISKRTNLYLSIDCIEQAEELNLELENENIKIKVLIIINSGLNRFGIEPQNAGKFYNLIKDFKNIEIVGIGTHPGQVYSSHNMEDVEYVANQEIKAMKLAKESLEEAGGSVLIVATGSTPTMSFAAKDKDITIVRPGNYVFYDNIQMSIGLVGEEDCALTVLATVISKPKEDVLLIDAGSKCLGLDKGAHGNSLIEGYGYIINHPELVITDLSEEVAKIKIKDHTNIKIGDKVEIIPNHSCSAANFTNFLIGHRGGEIEKFLEIDMRGGSIKRHFIEMSK